MFISYIIALQLDFWKKNSFRLYKIQFDRPNMLISRLRVQIIPYEGYYI